MAKVKISLALMMMMAEKEAVAEKVAAVSEVVRVAVPPPKIS